VLSGGAVAGKKRDRRGAAAAAGRGKERKIRPKGVVPLVCKEEGGTKIRGEGRGGVGHP